MKTQIDPQSLQILFNGEIEVKNSYVTICSKKTGKDFTYCLSKSFFNGRPYLHVKVEKNYLDFDRLGTFNGRILTKKGQAIETTSAKAIAWVLGKVVKGQFDVLNESVEIFHLGKCLKCGRILTDIESIKTGLGPHCRSYL